MNCESYKHSTCSLFAGLPVLKRKDQVYGRMSVLTIQGIGEFVKISWLNLKKTFLKFWSKFQRLKFISQ